MKKTLLLIASVALAMAACTNDVAEPNYGDFVKPGEVAFTATSVGTRTTMTPNAEGGLDVAWVGGEDQIGIFANDEASLVSTNAPYTAAESGAYTVFQAVETAIKWGTGVHNFYAYYPYVAASDLHQTAIPASIPAIQEQAAAGDLAHIQPLAFMYASKEASKGGTVDFSFVNAFSVLEVKLCAAEGTIACDAVIFRATDANEAVSASNIYVNLTNGALDFSSAETTNEIRVNLAEAVELNTETPASIYAMITPGHANKQFQAIAVVGGEEVVLGEMGVPESGIPAGRKATLSLNVPAPEVDPIDLSAAGTANCYIVNQANTYYKFNATVKGNGATALSTDVASIAPANAYLLWAQDQPMSDPAQPDEWPVYYGDTNAGNMIDVTSVELKEDGYIYFKTGAEMPNGNAVICATDAEGNIVWSWHMWVVNGYEAAANDVYVSTKGVDTYFMDRNLGAVGNPDKVANPDVNDYAAARGLCYQWGRKDPFTSNVKHNGYASKGMLYDAEGNGTSKYMTYGDDRIFQPIYCDDREEGVGIYNDINKIVAWTAAHPINYMRAGSTTSYAWISTDGATEEWGKLWGNQGWESSWDKGGVKTMYDPCPAGYRVPSTGHFIFITAHGDQASTGYGNNFRNWQFNSKEIIFDEAGAVLKAHERVEPYGLHFYINGTKTASEGAVDGVQDYGVTPAGLQTMYIPCQGLITYSGSPYDYNMYLQTNAPANAQTRWMKTEEGNFYYNTTSGSYDQQAKAMPVRCIRDVATVVPEPEPVDPAVDLSADATSNCYIVNTPATEYKFKATVKGNGYAPMAGETATIAPTKARILWAQAGYTMSAGDGDDAWPSNLGDGGAADLIDYESVQLKDGYVRFTTGENMGNGNVVIAATDDEGNILWSWHMWVLNGYDAANSDYYVTASDLNVYMMDRNLGATATTSATADTNNEWVGARGYFYQWGRKDPFIGHSIKWNGYEAQALVYDAEGKPNTNDEGNVAAQYVWYGDSQIFPRVSASNIPNAGDVYASVAYAVANPMTYISGGASYMWTAGNDAAVVSGATNEWGKLWGNQAESYSAWDKGGVKTMYDPCPAGYRVPSVGHFRFITSHGDNAGAYYNSKANWKYNTVENVFDENGAPIYANHGQYCPPYGFHFYVKGSKTADPNVAEGAQNNGVAPADQTAAYFPAQGLFRWNGDEHTSGDDLNVVMHTNTVKNAEFYGYATYIMHATAKGEFFNDAGTIGWGEQQAKALPVRCFRE